MGSGDEKLFVSVDGIVYPREDARVSVFDASFQSGHSVWEGMRVYNGVVFRLDEHLKRLQESATAVTIPVPSSEDVRRQIYEVLAANALTADCHIRMILSRGERWTSGMDPRNAIGPSTLVIIPEKKPVAVEPEPQRLVTASIRRPGPALQDPSIHHSNQLNSILARLEAIRQGADAALMLDTGGFIAEADSANIFCVIDDELVTPAIGFFLRGITRRCILSLARAKGYSVVERNITLAEAYSADEVFITGTVCEIVPVAEIDGRLISGNSGQNAVWRSLLSDYRDLVASECAASN